VAGEVVFPRVSGQADEGVLVTWLVQVGTTVNEGDVIGSVQVEKVEQDVYAPTSGRVVELLVAQGDIARQGDAIARIGTAASPTAPVAPPVASPAARRRGRELGVDLATVSGTGPGGRIVEADVEGAASRAGGTGDVVEEPGQPLSGPRRLLADRMRGWLAATAQYTLTSEVDVTDLAAGSPPWTAAAVRACALALRDHALLASRWHDDRLVPAEAIDIGVVVALPDGLVVPVVGRADQKDTPTLAAEIAALTEQARRGALRVEDVTGAVFAVSNLGAYPIDGFTPLVYQPNVAILGMGRARSRPGVVDGRIEPRTTLVLSLTVDHQVVDGVPAAAFLADVAALLAGGT
jgi:pyruvate dehydrogenase E2 component (dihydrolipoamide acetyltransferase)